MDDQRNPHLRMVVVAPDGPVAEVVEEDARRAYVAYPKFALVGPTFGLAREVDGCWHVLEMDCDTPQTARDQLAHHFLVLASERADKTAVAEFRAAANVLNWERHDEQTVAGLRYRVIRGQHFVRTGPDGPEPPRPTDADPAPIRR